MVAHSVRRRCAIYTRKSSDEGLEQDFNSLDAQREACAAFIASQKHEGWELIETHYDDGGYSGGTMERPALQQLLSDIEDGAVDVVIVYKVDRLSRALSDFAKMVEIFDAKDVSFVSVTQQFNTTTSMGRLTLNVLLSFAQFEREVTGERIRDKFAASKKKGMWMGGNVPLGYDIEHRRMIVNEPEAEQVRHIFDRYLVVGCVRTLRQELTADGYMSKVRTSKKGIVTGGKSFSRGALYALLQNPIYIGSVRHKDKLYPGDHHPIIDQHVFEQVQSKLSQNSVDRKSGKNSKEPSLLTGLLYDQYGRRLTPSHSRKEDRRYRYYVAQGAKSGRHPPLRIPAHDIEQIVLGALTAQLQNPAQMSDVFNLQNGDGVDCQHLFELAREKATKINQSSRTHLYGVLKGFITKIEVYDRKLVLTFSPSGLWGWLYGPSDIPNRHMQNSSSFEVPMAIRRRGAGTKLVVENGPGKVEPNFDIPLIRTVAQAYYWRQELLSGKARNIRELAMAVGTNEKFLSRRLKLAYLAPSIVEAILEGRQPPHLTIGRLEKGFSADWAKQHLQFGLN